MGKGVLWNGKYYMIPQAASRIDSSALSRSSLGGANKIAMLGTFTGLLAPKVPYKVGDPSLPLQLIYPGTSGGYEARLGAQLLFDPSPSSNGAGEVYLVAVNPCTPATLTLSAALKLDTFLYGATANQVNVTVGTGSATGTKKVTCTYQGNSEIMDNLGETSFTLAYTGTGTTATFTVDLAAKTLATTIGTVTGDGKSVDLTVYNTIQSVCDFLNSTGLYVATVGVASGTKSSILLDAYSNQTFYPVTLSAVTKAALAVVTATTHGFIAGQTVTFGTVTGMTELSGKSVTVYSVTDANTFTINVDSSAYATAGTAGKVGGYLVKSDLQAMVDGINSKSGYILASKVSATVGTVPTNTTVATYLTGGLDHIADVSSTDWDDALTALKALKIDLIVPLTSDPNLISKVQSHCAYMSGPSGKSERRAFVGGPLQPWVSTANRTAAILALTNSVKYINSDRIVHVGLGSKHYDANGKLTLYPAYITACMYTGIAGGSSPVEPLTRKFLRSFGLEADLTVSEIETLMEAAVAVPIADPVRGAGYVVSRQLTTWNQNDDLYRIEFSVGRGADYVAREVRNRHEDIIGQPGTETMDITIVNLTNAVLEAAKQQDYIRFYDPKKTQLRVDGTVRYVDYYAEPTIPINWIFSTYHLQPTKFSIGL